MPFKKTAEWKEEIALLDPAQGAPREGVLPDGTRVDLPPDQDPRRIFADWLVARDNPYFARSLANRAWFWLMEAQTLYLMNASDVQRRIERGPRLGRLLKDTRGKRSEIIDGIYLLVLSRHPSPAETAAYMMQTGRRQGQGGVYPSMGAIVSKFPGYEHGCRGQIPPYVILTNSQGRFSETGFLGPKYRPFVTGGDPSRERFAAEGLSLPECPTDVFGTKRDAAKPFPGPVLPDATPAAVWVDRRK